MHRHNTFDSQRKAFLERKGALKDREKEEENNDDENFMVLDSVGSDDGESWLLTFCHLCKLKAMKKRIRVLFEFLFIKLRFGVAIRAVYVRDNDFFFFQNQMKMPIP